MTSDSEQPDADTSGLRFTTSGDPRDLWMRTIAPRLNKLPSTDGWVSVNNEDLKNPLPDQLGEISSANQYMLLGFSAARDYLDALVRLLEHPDEPHVSAPFALIRGALEGLALTAWVGEPSTPTDRRLRATALVLHDSKMRSLHLAAYLRCRPQAGLGEDRSELQEQVDAMLNSGEGKRPKHSSTKAIYALDKAISRYPSAQVEFGPEWAWRMASGFSHSLPWALDLYSHVSDEPDPHLTDTKVRTYQSQWPVLISSAKTCWHAYLALGRSFFDRGIYVPSK